MLYKIPDYIAAAQIADPVIQYTWDDWHPRKAYGRRSDEVIDRLAKVTVRAKIATAIGIYEWIVYRYENLLNDSTCKQFAKAAWCGNISMKYMNYVELDELDPDEWLGPIRGVLRSATTILNELLFLWQDDVEPALHTAFLSGLAIHVLPDPTPFLSWQNVIIKRMNLLYTAPEEDPFDNFFEEDRGGALVPREALDPKFPFNPKLTASLIKSFLSSVDFRSNLFLLDSLDSE